MDTVVPASLSPLSKSQKKRLRLRLKQHRLSSSHLSDAVVSATATSTTTAATTTVTSDLPPVAPEAPTVTREALQARVKQLRDDARAKRALSKRAQVDVRTKDATKVGKDLMEQFRTGTLNKHQLESLAELEKEFYEDCHGDAALFCAKKKLDRRAASVIETAINRVKAGEAPERTLKDTVSSLASALSS